jgi:DNA-binding XRE family transcriptional regulator
VKVLRSTCRFLIKNSTLEKLKKVAEENPLSVDEVVDVFLEWATDAYEKRKTKKVYKPYKRLSAVSDKSFSTLRKVRVWRGWTQREIAKALGMSLSTYAKVESGTHRLSDSSLKEFCNLLDYDYTRLKVLS